jgi:hypothetical protein
MLLETSAVVPFRTTGYYVRLKKVIVDAGGLVSSNFLREIQSALARHRRGQREPLG